MPIKDRTILYIEDDKNMREWIVNNLEYLVKRVIVTDNCEDGLKLYYRNDDIDIIITDIYIDKPNSIDGLDMLKVIRKYDKYTPIFITTAYGNIDDLTRAINLDIDAFLVKVFKYETLKNKLIKINNILLDREEKIKLELIECEIYERPIINISKTIIYNPNTRTFTREETRVIITPSQAILFELLYSLKFQNQIATYATIYNEFNNEISPRVLIYNLRKRLSHDFSDIVIENIYGEGYRLKY